MVGSGSIDCWRTYYYLSDIKDDVWTPSQAVMVSPACYSLGLSQPMKHLKPVLMIKVWLNIRSTCVCSILLWMKSNELISGGGYIKNRLPGFKAAPCLVSRATWTFGEVMWGSFTLCWGDFAEESNHYQWQFGELWCDIYETVRNWAEQRQGCSSECLVSAGRMAWQAVACCSSASTVTPTATPTLYNTSTIHSLKGENK